MQNMRAYCNTDKTELHIVVDLTKDCGDSSTGKSTMVAKSEGWQPIDDDPAIAIMVNVIRKKRGEWRPVRGIK